MATYTYRHTKVTNFNVLDIKKKKRLPFVFMNVLEGRNRNDTSQEVGHVSHESEL